MPDALGDRAGTALAALLNRRSRVELYAPMTAGMAHLGVDPTSYPVLSGIDRHGPVSAAALAPLVGVERTVVSRYAARLEQSGLVARTSDPADRRASLLELTDIGHEHVATLRTRLARELDRRFADWPDGLAAAFVDGLERFVVGEVSE